MLKDENGIPRRSRLDLCESAEKILYDATQEIEKLGADVRLTNAIIKLAEARELVSDFIDEKKTQRTTEEKATTNETFDPGGDDTGGSNPPGNKPRP